MASEKYAARRGSVEDGMRLITACCARVPQRWTSRIYIHFLLMFQEVRLISKTRNQLFDIGDEARIENALAIVRRIKAAIKIEISPSEIQPDLFGAYLN